MLIKDDAQKVPSAIDMSARHGPRSVFVLAKIFFRWAKRRGNALSYGMWNVYRSVWWSPSVFSPSSLQVQLEWHPTAENILISAGSDTYVRPGVFIPVVAYVFRFRDIDGNWITYKESSLFYLQIRSSYGTSAGERRSALSISTRMSSAPWDSAGPEISSRRLAGIYRLENWSPTAAWLVSFWEAIRLCEVVLVILYSALQIRLIEPRMAKLAQVT